MLNDQPYYMSKMIEMGHYDHKEEVIAIYMPRGTWMNLVTDLLNDYGSEFDEIADEMKETASTMAHYPVATWLNAERGCGCVVGEYLVARDLVLRQEGNDDQTVLQALEELEDKGWKLSRFGNSIDSRLRSHLVERGFATEVARIQSNVKKDVVIVFE